MTTKTAAKKITTKHVAQKTGNSAALVEGLRKAMAPTLAELVSGKSEKVATAVGAHAAKRSDAEVKGKSKGEKARAENLRRAVAGKPAKKDGKPTIASAMREAIMKGLNNADVFTHARKVMGADVVTEDKKWFAAWYRADMKRKGIKNVPASKPTK